MNAIRSIGVPPVMLIGLMLQTVNSLFAAEVTIDFEELPLKSADSYYGADLAGGFESRGAWFNNFYADYGAGCCWNGWAYSQTEDTTTPGATNQYSAFPGGGAGASEKYGVAFSGFDGGGIIPEIMLPAGAEPVSVKVANTTYAALSMLHGDSFAKVFGGASGDDPDWYLLTVEGVDASDAVVGDVSFYLADYRFANNAQDYVLDEWAELDLTPLADLSVRKLSFRLTSTDNGLFGMNTPAYAAVDDLVLEVAALPGDFNLDGSVDQVDLAIWSQNYGAAIGANPTAGDADVDGDVDGFDFLAWQRNFAPSEPRYLTVPEPAVSVLISSWLIIAHLVGATSRMRRRQSSFTS